MKFYKNKMIINRFSPSPSGKLSIANLKVLLINWIYSKKNKGFLILRIDDTNQKKIKINSIKNFFKIIRLNKIKIKKFFFQSNKYYRYIEIIQFLKKKNIIYKNYKNKKIKFFKIYKNLNKKFKFIKKIFKKFNKNYTIFIFIKNKKNFLIIKINGIPIYNFSSIIDDNESNIKIIIRGIDHYENLRKQINIIKNLKKKLNKIIHIPIILNENSKKISKKNNKNKINFYYRKLFLKESLLNYLFNKKTKKSKFKIFSIKKFLKIFKFKKEKKSYFKINKKNIEWFNKNYWKKNNINLLKIKIKKNFQKKNKKKKLIFKIKKSIIKCLNKESSPKDIKKNLLKINKINFINIKKIKKEINKNIFKLIIKIKKNFSKKKLKELKKFLIEKWNFHKIIKLLTLEKKDYKNYIKIFFNNKLINKKIKISVKIIKIFIKSLSSKG